MMLTGKIRLLSLTGAIVLALIATTPFEGGVVAAYAQSVQTGSQPAATGEQFVGTWHWMFNGRSFSTMVLLRSGSGFTGTVTPSRIALNDNGGLLRADPSEDGTVAPIEKATFEGSVLRITVKEGFAFTVTLKDPTHAEILPVGAPPNMKPIPAEKVL
jgi:hypothetical protein